MTMVIMFVLVMLIHAPPGANAVTTYDHQYPATFRTGVVVSDLSSWYGVNSTHPTLTTASPQPGSGMMALHEANAMLGVLIILCRAGVRGDDVVASSSGSKKMSVSLEHISFARTNMSLVLAFINDGTCDSGGAVDDTVGVTVLLNDIDLQDNGILIITGNMTHLTKLSVVGVTVTSYTNKVPFINGIVLGVGVDQEKLEKRAWWSGSDQRSASVALLFFGHDGTMTIHGDIFFEDCMFEAKPGGGPPGNYPRHGVVLDASGISITRRGSTDSGSVGGFIMNHTTITGDGGHGFFLANVRDVISFSNEAVFGFFGCTFKSSSGIGFYVHNTTSVSFTNASLFVFEGVVFDCNGYAFRMDLIKSFVFSGGSSLVHRHCNLTSLGTGIMLLNIDAMIFSDGSIFAQYHCNITASLLALRFWQVKSISFRNGSTLGQFNTSITSAKHHAFYIDISDNISFTDSSRFVQDSCIVSAANDLSATTIPTSAFYLYDVGVVMFSGGSNFTLRNGRMTDVKYHVLIMTKMTALLFHDRSFFQFVGCTMSSDVSRALVFQQIDSMVFRDESSFELSDSTLTALVFGGISISSVQQFKLANRSSFIVQRCNITANPVMTLSAMKRFAIVDGSFFGQVNSYLRAEKMKMHVAKWKNIDNVTVDRGSSIAQRNCTIIAGPLGPGRGKKAGKAGASVDVLLFEGIGKLLFRKGSQLIQDHTNISATTDGSSIVLLAIQNVSFKEESALIVSNVCFNGTSSRAVLLIKGVGTVRFLKGSVFGIFNFVVNNNSSNGALTVPVLHITEVDIFTFRNHSTFVQRGNKLATTTAKVCFIDRVGIFSFFDQSAFAILETSMEAITAQNAVHFNVQTAIIFANESTFLISDSDLRSEGGPVVLFTLLFSGGANGGGLDALLVGGVSLIQQSLMLLKNNVFDCNNCANNAERAALGIEGGNTKFNIDTRSVLHVDNVTALYAMPILRFVNSGGIHFPDSATTPGGTPQQGGGGGGARMVIRNSFARTVLAAGSSRPPPSTATITHVIYSCNRNGTGPLTDVSASLWAVRARARVVPCASSCDADVLCFTPSTNDVVALSSSSSPPSEEDSLPSSVSSSCACECAAQQQPPPATEEGSAAMIGDDDFAVEVVSTLPCGPQLRFISPSINHPIIVDDTTTPSASISSVSPHHSTSVSEMAASVTPTASATVPVNYRKATRKHKITAFVQLLGNEEAAESIETSGTVSAGATGFITPTTAAYGSRTRSAQVVSQKCLVSSSGDEDDEDADNSLAPPSPMELPPVVLFSLGSGGGDTAAAGAQHGYVAAMMAVFLVLVAGIAHLFNRKAVADALAAADDEEEGGCGEHHDDEEELFVLEEEGGESSSGQNGQEHEEQSPLAMRAAVLLSLLNAVLLQFYAMPVATSAVTGIVAGGGGAPVVGGVVALLLVCGNALRIAHVVTNAKEVTTTKSSKKGANDAGGVDEVGEEEERISSSGGVHHDDDDGGEAGNGDVTATEAAGGGLLGRLLGRRGGEDWNGKATPENAAIAVYYDATHGFASLRTRLYFVEELAVSLLLGAVTGLINYKKDWIGGGPNSSCVGTTWVMVLLSALHFMYIGAFRPYRSRIETCFVTLQAVLQLAQNVILATGSTRRISAEDASTAIQASGACALVANVALVVEAVVLAVWSVRSRRLKNNNQNKTADHRQLEHAAAVPLLLVPESATTSSPNAAPRRSAAGSRRTQQPHEEEEETTAAGSRSRRSNRRSNPLQGEEEGTKGNDDVADNDDDEHRGGGGGGGGGGRGGGHRSSSRHYPHDHHHRDHERNTPRGRSRENDGKKSKRTKK